MGEGVGDSQGAVGVKSNGFYVTVVVSEAFG